jgi:hypothetical protein
MKSNTMRLTSILSCLLIFTLQIINAQPPELDHVMYGLFDYGCGEITPEDGIVVQARKLDGTVISSYVIGTNSAIENHFVLHIPMSLTPVPNKAVPGEELEIRIVDSNELTLFTSSHTASDTGTFAAKDLGDGQGGDVSNAGADQFVCSLTTQLEANQPVFGTGEWSILNGNGGQITDVNNPETIFSGQIGEDYQLQWTITSTSCPVSEDLVLVSFSELLTQANAGEDMQICGEVTELAANQPMIGEGMWSVFSGNAGSFEDAFDPYTTFYGQTSESYVLLWTISNSSCEDSVDDVTITMNAANSPELLIEGPDSSYCSQGVTLTASEGYDSYQWSHGPTARIVHVDGVGLKTYSVTGSLDNGCERLASHQIEFVPEDPSEIEVIVDLPSQSMCETGMPFNLRTLGACGGQAPFAFEWVLLSAPPEGGLIEDPNSPETSLTPYGTGVYIVQLTVEDSQSRSYSVSITLVVPHLEDNDTNGVLNTDDWWFRVQFWRAQSQQFPWLDADLNGSLNILDLLIAQPCETNYPAPDKQGEGGKP